MGTRLAGLTLGLFGLGRLGQMVARVGTAGFGMDAIAWSPTLTTERAALVGVRSVSRDELFRESDVLSIHARIAPGAPSVIGARELSSMEQSALVVNTSRGRIVDEEALVEALQSGTIRGAGLDVYREEPLPASHPLRSLPNTVLTAHAGHVTRERHRESYTTAVSRIRAYLDGSPEGVLGRVSRARS